MSMKRSAALILAGLMLSMAACNNSVTDGTKDTGNAVTDTQAIDTEPVETDYYDNIPENVRYDGKTFTILSYDSKSSWNVWFTGDETIADTMNQAAFRRNTEVEDMLGITIEQNLISGGNTKCYDVFVQEVMAGDAGFDLFVPWSIIKLTGAVTDNLCYSWTDLPVVDLSAPWYNQTANDAYSIAGKQYVAVSDITYPVQQHGRLLFNKELFDKNQLEYPYEAVFNGTWDFDMLLSLCKGYYADLNNNGYEDIWDQYGLVTGSGHIGTYPLNFGESIISFEDDELVLNYYSEKMANVISDLQAFHPNPDIRMQASGNEYDIFNEGRALFESYSSDPTKLRDIEFDFGYLPYPKYEASQDGYHTYTYGGVIVIPNVPQDHEFTGTVIEALSAASSKYLVDAWVENNIEGKILRDDESVQVYRMMRDTACYQLTQYIDPSGKVGYGSLLDSDTVGLASHYASIEQLIRTSFEDFYKKIADN